MTRLACIWTALVVLLVMPAAQGQVVVQPAASDASVNAWLVRLHEASRLRAYAGTFVVSAGGNMGSAKIWHVCDGAQQFEQIESMSGTARSTFRRNDQVVTFYKEAKVAVVEKRESLGLFPNLLQSGESDIGALYRLQAQGNERVAGLDTDVVHLMPTDKLRYGYRVWSEKRTGLVLQLQTLDLDGRVLEQVAFSNIRLDAPVSATKLAQLMARTDGYRVEHPEVQKTTADTEGWSMRQPVTGFKAVGCYKRPSAVADSAVSRVSNTMQWIFSDGLATVSLFAEPFDGGRHVHEGLTEMGGAAHTLTRRVNEWWITVVGEVPSATLNAFAQGLERKK